MTRFLLEKLQITLGNLLEQTEVGIRPIGGIEYQPTEGYKTDNTLPETGWEPFAPGQRISGYDTHFWFKAKVKTPPAKPGRQYMLRCTTGREGLWDATNPQGLVYLNGYMAGAFDTNHTEIFLDPDTEYVIHNYFYTGSEYGAETGSCVLTVNYDMFLVERDLDVQELYYDMRIAYESAMLLDEHSPDRVTMLSLLELAANMIDFRAIHSEAYYASIRKARDFIQSELYDKLCSTEGKPVVTCIGHTHIDVEWMWTRAQTREKIQRSFSTAKALMDRYPEYKFTLSQPELYRYLKEEAPEKYEELKQLVAEGRWEPEGAMWLEADCNLISGESFVRQIIHGKRFFQDEFGVDCNILFLPDVFGYSCALPQILKKSGVDHFVTSKISWNETNIVPMDTFMWKGLDGTEIFTNFITTVPCGIIPEHRTTYVGHLTPYEVHSTWKRYSQKQYNDQVFTTYGFGDGGGGPTIEMLETQRRLAKGMPGIPVTKTGFLRPTLDKIRENFDSMCQKTGNTPKWVGELYLEFHRGTYTSVAKNKRGNRYSEFMLGKSEALSQIASLSGGRYDKERFHKYWRMVLHNQFHDIIPGSSIVQVYDGTDKDYAEILGGCAEVVSEQLQHIADRVDGKGALVYNPSGFVRGGVVRRDGVTCELATEVPSFGWTVTDQLVSSNDIRIDGLTAESAQYILTLDKAGRIVRLYDKQNGREVFKPGECGNELQAFEDYPYQFDNWEISDYYKDKMWVLDDEATITPFSDGSSAGFKVVRRYMDSTIEQTIRLYSLDRRIDFGTEIDWHQKHQVLKAAFPFDVHTDEATYEIQFGHVTRPTHYNTSWEQAKFEVYGHKWVDMSETGYGVALLNDCKYGHSADGSTLKLTFLKSGTYPNVYADVGHHTFTYSLYPHAGDFRQGGVVQAAYALNQPLELCEANGDGTLPTQFSLVSCDNGHIIVETVKRAEADDATVVRLYEAHNTRGTARLTVDGGFTKAYLCDMLENELQELPFDGKTVSLPVKNFEILTVKFR